MNMRRLSLSVLVTTGLVLGSMPLGLKAVGEERDKSYKPNKIALVVFLSLLAVNYMLDCKESVKNPEENHKWSDLWSLNLQKTIGVLDEKILGQKAKGSSIKLTAGDKEIKETSKTPSTGLCGNGHAILTGVAKSAADTGKVLAAPALLIAMYVGGFKFIEKDGNLLPAFDPTKLSDLNILKST